MVNLYIFTKWASFGPIFEPLQYVLLMLKLYLPSGLVQARAVTLNRQRRRCVKQLLPRKSWSYLVVRRKWCYGSLLTAKRNCLGVYVAFLL